MNLLQAIFLGILQGLTEFLPISSSGHLVLFQKFFLLQTPPIFFDVLIHIGTLLAIIFYLRKDIVGLLRNFKNKENKKLIALIIFGTLPIGFSGFFLNNKIDEIFNSYILVGFSFLVTSAILAGTIFVRKFEKTLEKIGWFDSFFIGVFQAIAILPGISRSGSTISAGIFRGIDRKSSFKFSFLLSIPAITGALILQLFTNGAILKVDISYGIVGFLTSLGVGFLALRILEKILTKGKFSFFAIYAGILGIAVLLFLR